ncbi:unnamed protein product, partial [Mesorhabditis belari]|uniref:Uncharacterized protein n=1 Tax=Mesorhabditis belari TaxID=2138241 RepID=A0AAF3EZZ8_9BILA
MNATTILLILLISLGLVKARSSHRHHDSFDSFESTTRSEDSLEEPRLSIQDTELQVAHEGKVKHKMGATFRGRAKNEQKIYERSEKNSGDEIEDNDERSIPLQPPTFPTEMVRL